MRLQSYAIHFFIFLVFLTSVASNDVISQSSWITEATVIHNDEARSALSVKLMAEPKTVKKAWKHFLDKQYDMNVKGIGFLLNKDILTAEKVYLPGMKDHKLDLYAKVIPANSSDDLINTHMLVFASYGYDMYINRYEHRGAYRKVRSMFNTFLDDFLPDYYKESLENVEEELSDLQKDRQQLIEENTEIDEEIRVSYTEIEMLKEDISNMKESREENMSEIKELEARIESQSMKLQKIQDRFPE